jgi:hypothetical protein
MQTSKRIPTSTFNSYAAALFDFFGSVELALDRIAISGRSGFGLPVCRSRISFSFAMATREESTAAHG